MLGEQGAAARRVSVRAPGHASSCVDGGIAPSQSVQWAHQPHRSVAGPDANPPQNPCHVRRHVPHGAVLESHVRRNAGASRTSTTGVDVPGCGGRLTAGTGVDRSIRIRQRHPPEDTDRRRRFWTAAHHVYTTDSASGSPGNHESAGPPAAHPPSGRARSTLTPQPRTTTPSRGSAPPTCGTPPPPG